MAIRDEKAQVVAELEEKLKAAQSTVLADYRGMKVADATRLRRKMREAGVEMRVVKNTLTKIAADNCGLSGLDDFLSGPTAVAFSYHDPVLAAKIFTEFAKTSNALVIKGGVVEGQVIDFRHVKVLAALPSKDVLVSMVLRGLNGPLTGLCTVLQGPIRKLAYALKAIEEQKAVV